MSELQISSVSTFLSDDCLGHMRQKRRRIDDLSDNSSSAQGSSASRNQKPVQIHQRTSRFPKGYAFNTVEGQEDPISIEQRLDGHSGEHTALFDKLSCMPLPNHCDLADHLVSRGYHASNDMVLETLLAKLEDTNEGDTENFNKPLRYSILWLRNMIHQRKFLAARKILQGICANDNFESFPPYHRLQIQKLALLVDVHENIDEPRHFGNIEAKCIALLVEHNATEYKSDRYWPKNLILAYMFRLYGRHDRELRQDTVDRMSEICLTQFQMDRPSISLVWTAQQYVRWCLRRREFENADHILKCLAKIVGKSTSEYTQNAVLENYKKVCPRKNRMTVAAQTDDLYDEHNKVDEQWLNHFRNYLWDEPYAYMEDPRMRSRKEHDTVFWH